MEVNIAVLKFVAVAGALAAMLLALVLRMAARDPDFWRKWALPQHPQFGDTAHLGIMLGRGRGPAAARLGARCLRLRAWRRLRRRARAAASGARSHLAGPVLRADNSQQ